MLFGVLYFPFGLMIGYPAVALGYLGNRAGLPVSASAAIVGMAFLPHAWKFLWAPLGDLTLTRKRWYRLATGCCALGVVAMSAIPIRAATVPLLSVLVLLSNLAATFVAFSVEGLMAHNTPARAKGRAAGWFQTGNQLGQTLGGGIGLWLAAHLPAPWMAGAVLAAVVLACWSALAFVDEPPRVVSSASVTARVGVIWRELWEVARSRSGWIGLLLAVLPIGSGAALYLFSALAHEWNASANTVAVVLGAAGGVAVAAGCLAGGWLADRISRPVAYAASTALMAVAAVGMALTPRTAPFYAAATLAYTLSQGMCVATLTGLILGIVGHGAAATKINLFIALNTLSGLVMVRVDGAVHDRWQANGMLYTEAAIGAVALVAFIALALLLPPVAAGAAAIPADAPARGATS
jgi:PAT family beta-lactamase induction signal transducer AmpG